MSCDQTENPPLSKGTYYQIKVKGHLDTVWSERLGGLQISSTGGETTLIGLIIDQAALHGLLIQIRDLGLPLLLVQQTDSISKLSKGE